MFNVTTAELPALSYLNERKEATDFLDCYSVVSDMPARRAAEIITKFPGWARLLLSIRGVLMAPFGISNEGPDAPDKLGIFPVEIDSEREIVAGFNDKHLDFRVSVISFNGRVFLSTWVHPHNIGGRLYLMAILPFHILIAREALNRVGRHQEYIDR